MLNLGFVAVVAYLPTAIRLMISGEGTLAVGRGGGGGGGGDLTSHCIVCVIYKSQAA